MKKLLLTKLLLLHIQILFGQSSYKASTIPPALLTKASAVVRQSEIIIEIKSIDHVILKNKTAITILNKTGDSESDISIWYDKSRKIKNIKGNVYDENGNLISKITEKKFSDISAASDFSLYEDSRMKVFSVDVQKYPYTIEYEYEIKVNQSLSLPDWYPLNTTETSVENSSLTVIYPINFNLRYKEINFIGTKEESTKETKVIKWTATNLRAIKLEPYSPEPEGFLTIVKLASQDFFYDGLTGKFSDWNEYGKWVNDILLKDRLELSAATIYNIRELVKDVEEPKEKAKIIYEFMQQKTRYISVQIGIGGFQPYPAAEVDRLGYGDCKGLVNYTRALLRAVDIESYYSVVNAGRFKEDVSVDFASINDGNHAILCIPFNNDTTWVECTNQQIPFGYLGDFTDDRMVIVCTPEGGKLMRTPKLDWDTNKQIRNATFVINQSGDLSGKMNTIFEGAQYDNHEMLLGLTPKEQEITLTKIYPLSDLEISNLDYTQDKKQFPQSVESIQLISKNFAAVSENNMVFTLNSFNKNTSIPKELRNRTQPVYINRGYTDIDEYSYEIPEGFKLDSYSTNVSIEKEFGSYKTEISVHNKTITYKRTVVLKEGLYPVDQYSELISFYKSMTSGDGAKAYLIKQN